jgi:acyl-CoA hydrolase
MPQHHTEVETCVEALIRTVGPDLRLAVPLGLGKPVALINALYARVKADPQLSLTVLTALSLARPVPGSELERAFLAPFLERVFGDAPELDYVADQRRGSLPANVRICEFYFAPGSQLGNAHAQRDYICTNYTFAARDVFLQGCNLVAQMVACEDGADGPRYSLACNPDTGPELVARLREAQRRGERRVAVIAQVNRELPFMAQDAEVGADFFDHLIDHPRYRHRLFPTPKQAVADADHAIGLHVSTLIRDGGTLQIGIGQLGDAIVNALLLRHRHNADYRAALAAFGIDARYRDWIAREGGVAPFEQGLYGASEMFVDGFLHLMQGGVLRRAVYDFWALQQLINEGRCDPQRLDARVLEAFDDLGVRVIRGQDFERLQHHGFFKAETRYQAGELIAPDGTRVRANLADPEARRVIAAQCLGTALENGVVLHAGFFLGPGAFYQALRELPEAERRRIVMTGVDKVNQLDHNRRLYRAQRVHARFINTAMMVTMNGAAVSDGLEDHRVVSGVGGQYNFVAMAHQLPTGRSLLMVRAARQSGGQWRSNLVFNYGHCTIPRHLRDLVVTEYGMADLRGRTDAEVAKALLAIADSRFQPALLRELQDAGRIERGWTLPEHARQNTPEALAQRLAVGRPGGAFPDYPFGHDFTEVEAVLAEVLPQMKQLAGRLPRWRLLLKGLRGGALPPALRPYLARMDLLSPATLQQRVAQRLLIEQLRARQHPDVAAATQREG